MTILASICRLHIRNFQKWNHLQIEVCLVLCFTIPKCHLIYHHILRIFSFPKVFWVRKRFLHQKKHAYLSRVSHKGSIHLSLTKASLLKVPLREVVSLWHSTYSIVFTILFHINKNKFCSETTVLNPVTNKWSHPRWSAFSSPDQMESFSLLT